MKKTEHYRILGLLVLIVFVIASYAPAFGQHLVEAIEQDEIAEAKQGITEAEQALERVTERYDLGQATTTEVSRAKIDLAEAQIDLAEIERRMPEIVEGLEAVVTEREQILQARDKLFDLGESSVVELNKARIALSEARIQLEEYRRLDAYEKILAVKFELFRSGQATDEEIERLAILVRNIQNRLMK